MEFFIFFEPVEDGRVLPKDIWHPLDFSVFKGKLIKFDDFENTQIIELIEPLNNTYNNPQQGGQNQYRDENYDFEVVGFDKDIGKYSWLSERKLDQNKHKWQKYDGTDLGDKYRWKINSLFVKT